MAIEYRHIHNGCYEVSCKFYLPDSGRASHVILGVHGFAGDKESSALQRLAEKVTLTDTALVCFDLPAHGNSPVQEDQLTIANCMTDLLYMAEYCRQQFPDATRHLFATSFGGFIALLSAEKITDFQIVLRAPAVTMPEHILMDLLQMTPLEFEQHSPVQCGFERSLMLPYSFYQEITRYSVMNQEFCDDMLVIHGDADDVVPHIDIKQFCAGNPRMMLHVIPGADHRFKNPGEIEEVVMAACQFWGLSLSH